MRRNQKIFIFFSLIFILGIACEPSAEIKTLEVTASAYNSLPSQTNAKHPTTAAWGDELKPGMKCIAVSRDLIALGLTHNTEVTIEGLPGVYKVLDKMNARWTNKIDIYMGVDRKAALEWGKKKVKISWEVMPVNAH